MQLINFVPFFNLLAPLYPEASNRHPVLANDQDLDSGCLKTLEKCPQYAQATEILQARKGWFLGLAFHDSKLTCSEHDNIICCRVI